MGDLGHRDSCGLFEACGDNRLGQGQLEDGRKHWCLLVSEGLEDTAGDAVWSCSLPGVYPPESLPYFKLQNQRRQDSSVNTDAV